ncbi:MAG: sugar phosphate isomerase/epimerase [Treponema sp.]|jgi:sugar phosphate isomerase/epimerase|nr:sugar phosphate isomerase/epimerase [Treponema sp.]
MKIGVQMYTVREYLKTPKEINSSLKRIKEMGFDMVQLSGNGPIDNNELAAMLKDNGIQAVGTHSPWERVADKDELARLIEEHKVLGCGQIGIGIKPNIYPDTYDGYTGFIKKVNEICDQLDGTGLGFGYHNHELEFMKFNGVCAMDRLIEECPKCEFTLDVFWVQAGGKDPCEYMDKLKNRIRILHLKDYRVCARQRQFAEIGQGNLNWPAIFSRCDQYGIPCAVIEQDGDFLKDPFESLALSRKFLVDEGYWKN